MSEPVNPGAPAAPPAPPTAPPPAAPPGAAPATEPRIDHKEIVGLRTETRELLDQVKKLVEAKGAPATAPVTAPTNDAGATALAKVEEVQFDLALEKAFSAAKLPEDSPLREVITTAAKASKPPDLRAYVARFAGVTVTTAPVVPPPATAPSNTGAPTAPPTAVQLPENPFHWPPDAVAKLKPEEFHELVAKWEHKNGRGNPMAPMRQRAEAARKR